VTYLADPRLLGDDDALKHIERWISHPLVARYLNEPDTREYMLAGRDQAAPAENMARWEQLQSSITQWGDFYLAFEEYDETASERIPRVSRWIRRSFAERHFGPIMIWRLWNQSNVMDFSSDNPVLHDYKNLLLGAQSFLGESVSLLEVFYASLKAYMGIAAVLAVVWWSRFPPDAIASRAMSVLKLWAESTGIREVGNGSRMCGVSLTSPLDRSLARPHAHISRSPIRTDGRRPAPQVGSLCATTTRILKRLNRRERRAHARGGPGHARAATAFGPPRGHGRCT
jgi:hypothetical protein